MFVWVIISFLNMLLMPPLSQQQDAVVLTAPHSIRDAFEGHNVTFSCTVSAKEVSFFINGEALSEPSVAEKGFTASLIYHINDTTRQQNLSAVARANINNNTNITCRAQTVEGTDVSIDISDPPAALLVQGRLSSVVDLSYSFIDSSTVKISWSPPFTLPGTDITGYNVSVAVMDSFVSNTFTTNTYHVFHNYSHCDEVIITVSGYNELDGNVTSISIEPIVMKIEFSVDRLLEEEQFVHIRFNINVSNLCPDQYPTHINLTIQYANNGVQVTADNIPLISTNDTNILTTSNNHSILLPVNNNYTATITFSNMDIISTLNFSTHRTLSATPIDTAGPFVVFVCHFSPYSDAVGCLIELVHSNDSNVQFTGTGNKSDNNVAIVTIDGVYSGMYQLLVYEIEEDHPVVLVSRRNISIILPMSSVTPSSELAFGAVFPSSAIPIESISISTSEIIGVFPSATPSGLSADIVSGIVIGVVATLVFILVAVITAFYCRNHQIRKSFKEEYTHSNNYEDNYQLSKPSLISSTIPNELPIMVRPNELPIMSSTDSNTETQSTHSDSTLSQDNPVMVVSHINKNTDNNVDQGIAALVASGSDQDLVNTTTTPNGDEGTGILTQQQQKQSVTTAYAEIGSFGIEGHPRRRVNDQSVIYSEINPSIPPAIPLKNRTSQIEPNASTKL